MPTPDETRKVIEAALMNYSANQEHFEMAMRQMAEMYYMRFRVLVGAGFTEVQAMDILKSRGIE